MGASTGLTSAEAARRLAAGGPNVLPRERPASAWTLLARQMTHFFALLLWAAAALALFAGLPPLAVAIVVIVVLNGTFAFAQEYRADRAADRLRTLMPARAHVLRDGQLTVVGVGELVCGDVVLLGGGDRLGADLRVRSAHSLEVDESLLTGESVPVRPGPGDSLWAGTFVVEGEAEALVEAVGPATRIAGIADLTRQAQRPPSPLTVQLSRVSRLIAVIAVMSGVLLGAAAIGLGIDAAGAFLFGVGVSVALVPEGLLPTVTLSLARGARLMAGRHALVRRLDAVETLGATTFVCTDKTGTLTRNEMSAVEIWTPAGLILVDGEGYRPDATVTGAVAAVELGRQAARSARWCVRGRANFSDGRWAPAGDPMEVALDVLARRLGAASEGAVVERRLPFSATRMNSAAVISGVAHVMGAPDILLERCVPGPDVVAGRAALDDLTASGRRVVAVARRSASPDMSVDAITSGLDLLALVALEDPPRPDVSAAIDICRRAGIRVAMVTGDHLGTARSVAVEVGLLQPGGVAVEARDLPAADHELAAMLDRPEGAVVARVTPADKLRIARALRGGGHVVAMTGDGVNDAPALRESDVGVAMGRSGSDVAREAADLVLLDDHFGTITAAIELGRATFANIRRFLTYHLTDNVAELVPFVVWALSGGSIPLAIGVVQILALDIGTDMLPALALGTEPPGRRTMSGPTRTRSVIDGSVLRRSLLLLGPTEAFAAMTAFVVVLMGGGWRYGAIPPAALLATASGTAFAVIAVCQMANAVACRSETVPVWKLDPRANLSVALAIVAELVLLVVFVGVPFLADVLGGTWPSPLGWAYAAAAAGVLIGVDALAKRRRRPRAGHPVPSPDVSKLGEGKA